VPDLTLHNGVVVPQLGFGVFQVPPDEAQRTVEHALEVGYRHIDTAAAYNNESGVGAAVKASGLPRDEVFVTTKLRNGEQGYESALQAYADSCERLGLDHADLYLIHWPFPSAGRYVDSWRALEKLYADGAVRAVGVSNFLPEHLDELSRASDLVPTVNQIELHPTFQQRELAEDCRRRGIAVEAYSPLGQGADLSAPAVAEIAEAHEVTAAQVILRWHLQSGHIVIPKSNTPQRIVENLSVDGFELTSSELEAVDALEAGSRIGGDPATFALSQIR
jgi:diketogulonate reductase-like aldo/keto reductase